MPYAVERVAMQCFYVCQALGALQILALASGMTARAKDGSRLAFGQESPRSG